MCRTTRSSGIGPSTSADEDRHRGRRTRTVTEQAPAVGLWRDDHHRYYVDGQGPLPSVTTIVKVIDKSGPLMGWAKKEVAACAVRNLDKLKELTDQHGPDVARDWLKTIPDRNTRAKADLGNRVHEMADMMARGLPIAPDPEEYALIQAHERFLADRSPRIFLSECMVANLTLGFGGTFDFGAEIDGENILVDIKSGALYAEHALQLSGYDQAEFYGWPGSPDRMALPRWDGYALLQLRPGEDPPYRYLRVDITDDTRAAFRAALDLHRWTQSNNGGL